MALRKPLYMAAEGYSEELATGDHIQLGGLAITSNAIDPVNNVGLDLGGFNISSVADPARPADAATKAYVDAVAAGLAPKAPVYVLLKAESDGRADVVAIASTDLGNPTTLDLTPTPDGVALSENDRVLLTAQGTASQNGVWVAHASGGWTRAADMAVGSHGEYQFVHAAAGGATYGNTYWICTTAAPNDVVGTNGLTFVRTLYGLGTTVDGIAVDTAGMRVLLADPNDPYTTSGIWVAAAGAWTRPTDYANGAHAGHAYCFVEAGTVYQDTGWVVTTNPPGDVIGTNAISWVQFSSAGVIDAGAGLQKTGNIISVKAGDGIETTSNGNATNVALATNPGLELVGTSPAKRLAALVAASQGLQIDGANGLALLLNGTTLQVAAGGVSVKGLPLNFEINGTAVHSATPGTGAVTAANLDTLTAGSTSNADSLHTHSLPTVPYAGRVEGQYAVAEAVAAGDPLYPSSTNDRVGKGDAASDAKSRIIGVARTGQAVVGSAVPMVSCGPVSGVLTGATAGVPYYLQAGGGLGTSVPGAGRRVIRVGFATNATDLFVTIADYGKKAA